VRIRLLVLTLGIVCVAGSARAQYSPPTPNSPENFHLEAGVMFWKPTPEIVISSGSLSTPIDFVNTFTIEKKRIPEFRLVLKPGRRHKLRFGTETLEYSGTAPLTQRIRFQGQTFNVGVPTTADLSWRLMRAGYEWDPIATSMGYLGIFGDVKFNTMKASLSALLLAESFERNVPVPTIGVSGRGYLTPLVSVSGEFTGLKINNSRFNAKFYDVDLYATANFGRNFGTQLGYRSVTVDYVVDEDTGDLKLKGPYLGLVVRF
jgi:hypothetical protein